MSEELQKKQVVVGLGEIGKPIKKLLSRAYPVLGYDVNSSLVDHNEYKKFDKLKTLFLHVCIPFTNDFVNNVISNFKKFQPEYIIIHSTISPHTTEKIQKKVGIPVIYSATRGVHKRMLYDLKRYTKFFAVESDTPNNELASQIYSKIMKKCGVKTKQMSSSLVLELAKIIVDTSYYGWLINYAQLSNIIAIENKVNYDEMWSFADEIHKYLGNRPKMFPGHIGGHCVIPNLSLIQNQTLDLIKKINESYSKKLNKRLFKNSE